MVGITEVVIRRMADMIHLDMAIMKISWALTSRRCSGKNTL